MPGDAAQRAGGRRRRQQPRLGPQSGAAPPLPGASVGGGEAQTERGLVETVPLQCRPFHTCSVSHTRPLELMAWDEAVPPTVAASARSSITRSRRDAPRQLRSAHSPLLVACARPAAQAELPSPLSGAVPDMAGDEAQSSTARGRYCCSPGPEMGGVTSVDTPAGRMAPDVSPTDPNCQSPSSAAAAAYFSNFASPLVWPGKCPAGQATVRKQDAGLHVRPTELGAPAAGSIHGNLSRTINKMSRLAQEYSAEPRGGVFAGP